MSRYSPFLRRGSATPITPRGRLLLLQLVWLLPGLVVLSLSEEHPLWLLALIPLMALVGVLALRIRCPRCHEPAFLIRPFSNLLWQKQCAQCGADLSSRHRPGP
jgi:hypothetical protein